MVQRLVVGAEKTLVPCALPHAPLTAVVVLLAEQLAVAPPLEPVQDHDQGPVPETLDVAPTVQRFVVGATLTLVPFALPQVPATAAPPPLPAPLPGYALFDPGSTGTPPGTSTRTMLTFAVTCGWSEPICTTLVPATRSVIGIVTARVRHVPAKCRDTATGSNARAR